MISVYPVDGTLNLTDISCMGESASPFYEIVIH
jgi:hypothetical protein